MDVDREQFATLVRQHQSMVWSIAYHFLRDGSQAEDVAQDVFLNLYRALPALEGPDHVAHWLRRVTTHRCIDVSRLQRLRNHSPLEDAEAGLPAPSQLRDPWLAGRLRKLTASLPERARAIVILRYQEDLQPAEIAAALDLPVGTVKSQLQRSLAVLRQKLERIKVRVV